MKNFASAVCRAAGRTTALLVLAGALLSGFVTAAQAVSTTIVISEFRTRGPLGGNDEFIELYNLSAAAVDISGYRILRSNATTGCNFLHATIPAATILGPGCHFLLTNATAGTGYSGAVPGDMTYLTGVAEGGGLALTLPDGTTFVDQVGTSTATCHKEGSPILPTMTTNQDQSYERKPGTPNGNGQDTDDNATDFVLHVPPVPSNPQNMASPCFTPPPPTGGCCQPSGCSITTAAECQLLGGSYLGDNSDCSACGSTGNIKRSWGTLKTIYR